MVEPTTTMNTPMSKMNALGHCMRKALSLIWGVWRNGQDFDPGYAVEA